jgi:hypothetical protein
MRGLILGLAVGLAALLTAGEGRADYLNGQKLYDSCKDEDLALYCIGYIVGVYDAGIGIGIGTDKRQWYDTWAACVPEGRVSAGQLVEVVKKWMREHPANWHFGAASLVAEALRDSFPCR